MLTFDEEKHLYYLNGKHIPNVTSLLELLTDFSKIPKSTMEAARVRGTFVHIICELHDKGELDPSAIRDEHRGYYEAYLKFLAEHAPKWEMIEEKVYDKLLGYAGTLDRFGKVAGIPHCVLDIKTTAQLYASVGPQLSAYKNALYVLHKQLKGITIVRVSLRLAPDGIYKLDVLPAATEKRDWAAFMACLTIHNYRKDHHV